MQYPGSSDGLRDPHEEPGRAWILRQPRRTLIIAARVLAVAFLVVIVVMALNTARFSSKQIHPPPVPPLEPLSGYAERLSRAIQIRTIAAEPPAKTDASPFLELRSFLERSFPLVHSRLEREIHGGQSLLYRWKGMSPLASRFS